MPSRSPTHSCRPNVRRSAASRAGSLGRFGLASRAARRLQRLVRQPADIPYGPSRIQNALESFVYGLLGGKGVRYFRLDEDNVGAFTCPLRVLAADATLHRGKIVLRAHVVNWDWIRLLHKSSAHALWRS